jgi:hypothetical protein
VSNLKHAYFARDYTELFRVLPGHSYLTIFSFHFKELPVLSDTSFNPFVSAIRGNPFFAKQKTNRGRYLTPENSAEIQS